jgi:hypothetical protein
LLDTRTLSGRRVWVDPRRHNPVGTSASCIVQGSAGDGIKTALALLWERRDQCPGAFPVLAVHDEIVVEADADKAEQTAAWLKEVMIDAMQPLTDPVPCEVEVSVAQTWGGEPAEGWAPPSLSAYPRAPTPQDATDAEPARAIAVPEQVADTLELHPHVAGTSPIRRKTYPQGVVYCGDAREIIPQLTDIACVITDPPYGQNYDCTHRHGKNSKRAYAGSIMGDKDQTIGQEVIDMCFARGWPVLAFANPKLPWKGDWRQHLCWNKGGGVGGGGATVGKHRMFKLSWELLLMSQGMGIIHGTRDEAVLTYKMCQQKMDLHPTQKHIDLMIYLVEKLTNCGDTILDPCAGSFTTAIACLRTGRRFICIDVDPYYYRVGKRRIREALLEKAA